MSEEKRTHLGSFLVHTIILTRPQMNRSLIILSHKLFKALNISSVIPM